MSNKTKYWSNEVTQKSNALMYIFTAFESD